MRINNTVRGFVDITTPEYGVEILIRQDGKVLWVSVDGNTVLRVNRVPHIDIVDSRITGDEMSNKATGDSTFTDDELAADRIRYAVQDLLDNLELGDGSFAIEYVGDEWLDNLEAHVQSEWKRIHREADELEQSEKENKDQK